MGYSWAIFKKEILRGPNLLSFSRIAIFIAFLSVWLVNPELDRLYYYAGLLLYLVGCITDLLDGLWARRSGKTTRLGAFLDPLADKILHLGTLVLLGVPAALHFYYGWLLWLEGGLLAVSTLSFLRIVTETPLSANRFGKIKVWLESGLITSLFFIQFGVTVVPGILYAFLGGSILFASLSLAGKMGLFEELKSRHF